MLSAKELDLTVEEFNALIAVRDKLANGQFTYVANVCDWERLQDASVNGTYYDEDEDEYHTVPRTVKTAIKENPNVFDMGCIIENVDCCTIGCIAGWMGKEMTRSKSRVNEWANGKCEHPINRLFYPHDIEGWQNITPAIAVVAINNYLNTGNPKWYKAFNDA